MSDNTDLHDPISTNQHADERLDAMVEGMTALTDYIQITLASDNSPTAESIKAACNEASKLINKNRGNLR